MVSWVVWSVSVFVALLLGLVSSHFSIRTLRWVGFITLLILVVAITTYGTRYAPSDIGGAFADGAKNLSSAFFRPVWSLFHGSGEPTPGLYGWIVIAVALAFGYRQLEAFAMRRQPPVLDVSKVSTKQPNYPGTTAKPAGSTGTARQFHDWIAAELKFRLAAVEVRAPAILPGGNRTDGLARIAEVSGFSGGGLAGAVIRFLGVLWPSPERYELYAWVEAVTEGGEPGSQLTVQLDNPRTGITVANKTIAADKPSDIEEMAAGFIAQYLFAADRATPPWCKDVSGGRDLGTLLLSRQHPRANSSDAQALDERIAILSPAAKSSVCTGIVRYELAQLYDMKEDHLAALELHAANREQFQRFYRGRYRLAISLEAITSPDFRITDLEQAKKQLNGALKVLYRCGAMKMMPEGTDLFTRQQEGWNISPTAAEIMLKAAASELRQLRRQLSLPVIMVRMLRYRDERAVWRPYWQLRRRQAFRDGTLAAELLVDVRQAVNAPRTTARRECVPLLPRQRRAVRLASAAAGDTAIIENTLCGCQRQDRHQTKDRRPTPPKVRRIPLARTTESWQAAYNTACIFAACTSCAGTVGRDCAAKLRKIDEMVVASLERALGSRDRELGRPYDWISHDPAFSLLRENDGQYEQFHLLLRSLEEEGKPLEAGKPR